MLKAGICGFGALGHVHANSLCKLDGVEVKAVCDINPDQLSATEVKFNIAAEQGVFDINSATRYLDYSEMLAREKLDLVVIATPSDLHADYSIMAMDAGCHVFCEKPMSLTVQDCDRVIAARDRNRRQLMIGQCIRFWPEYEYLQACVSDGRYGKLKSLMMERIASYHVAGSWFNDHKRSGGAILDLHVHDVDWTLMALGQPGKITARGLTGETGGIDDISSIWQYGDSTIVTIRGSWMYSGFRMSYTAFFQNATVEYHPGTNIGFRVSRLWKGAIQGIQVPQESGYPREMRYFLECVRGEHGNTRCTPENSRQSIETALRERDMCIGVAQ
jgi:predicted dehydrogenase